MMSETLGQNRDDLLTEDADIVLQLHRLGLGPRFFEPNLQFLVENIVLEIFEKLKQIVTRQMRMLRFIYLRVLL